MSESDKSKVKIAIGELRVGHFVDLELSWTDHPFLFSRFKISSQAEIDAIREMGLKEVTVLPDRSDVKPPQRRASDRPEGTTSTAAPAAAAPASAAQPALSGSIRQQLWNRKQDLIHRASGFRSERQQVANRYTETVRKINTFARDVRSAPANAIMVAEEIVEEMASAFDKESSVLLNLVNLNGSEYTIYSHALNVTVLSLVLGRHVGLEPEDLRVLGMGAIVHDIGKIEIPTQITAKTTPLNAAEEALLRTHTTAGARLAQRIRALPNGVIEIIERHHEHVDGSGYPRGLKGDHIPLVVRIVAIANVYDNLCNPPDPSKGISPRDAMGLLFKNYINVFDAELINKFILAMGVYPPGTVVQLSDDNIGMVVSVDPDNLLRPRIILYNPDIPRSEALMVDLRERPDIQIRNVMKPREFPVRIYEYLGITERLGYFYKTPEQGR